MPEPESTDQTSGVCAHCGVVVPPGSGQCPQCGRWQPSNVASLKTGAFSKQVARGLGPSERADIDTRREQILADLGGRESLSQLSVDTAEKAVTVHALLTHVGAKLVHDGLFGERGRARPALGAYCQLLDRWVRLATLLGLNRRQKVVQSLDQFVDQCRRPVADDEPEALAVPVDAPVVVDHDRPEAEADRAPDAPEAADSGILTALAAAPAPEPAAFVDAEATGAEDRQDPEMSLAEKIAANRMPRLWGGR